MDGVGVVTLGWGMCDKGCPSPLGVCPVLAPLCSSKPSTAQLGGVGASLGCLQGKVPWGGTFPTRDPCHGIRDFSATGHQGPDEGTSGCHWPVVPVQTSGSFTDSQDMENHGQKGQRRQNTEIFHVV